VSFGRQKNLVRRPVRPDGRVNRELRRRAVGKTSLLDAQTARPSFSVRLAKIVAKLFKK
jgi:hypothetical protein